MKFVISVIFTVTCLLSMPGKAIACTCVERSAAEYFQMAGAVFLGKVVQINDGEIKFEVEKSWKSVAANEATVYTVVGGPCPLTFNKGNVYLIYANKIEGALRTGVCMGTAEHWHEAEQITDLEKRPTIPLPKKSLDNNGSVNILRIALITGLFLLLSIGIGLILNRLRKRAA
jgi:hypothetical protein